jgi:hypothetical protein
LFCADTGALQQRSRELIGVSRHSGGNCNLAGNNKLASGNALPAPDYPFGPSARPGGDFIIDGLNRQGAAFLLVGQKA